MRACRSALMREENGGAVLEIALVLPVFLLMVLGAMQFGLVLFGYCSESFAARSVVRYASVHSSSSITPATSASIRSYVLPYLWMGSQVGSPTVTPTWSSGNNVGGTVKVSVSVVYNVVLPYTPLKQVTITAVSSRLIVR